jgi:hypothetical protein
MSAVADGQEDEKMLPFVSCLQLQQMGDTKNVHVLCLRKTELLCLVIVAEVGMSASCVICVSVCAKWIDSMRAEWISACHIFLVVHCTFIVLEKWRQNCFYFK